MAAMPFDSEGKSSYHSSLQLSILRLEGVLSMSEPAVLEAAAVASRFLVGFALVTAALPKVVQRRDFERAVRGYGLLPARVVRPVARGLPVVELIVGALLLSGIFFGQAAFCAGVVLVGFSFAVGVNLLRGREIDCGCRGAASSRQIGWGLVVTDILLAGTAFLAWRVNPEVLIPNVGGGHAAPGNVRAVDAVAIVLIVMCAVAARALVAAAARLGSTIETIDTEVWKS